jgi:aminoglycoside phosphotransferase (APT) family kinase protein
MILEKFKGIRLDTIWNSLSKEEKIKITRKLGEVLARIHQINLEDFGYIRSGGKINRENRYKFKDKGEQIPSSRFLKHLMSAFFEDIALFSSYKEISRDLLSKMSLYVISKIDSLDYGGKPTLIHNDFMIGHIFVEKINNEYEITGIIDFEFAESSDPEYEFIKLHRQGFFDDSELKNALDEGYGRKINDEKVWLFRLLRDFSLARVILDSGDKEHCDRILKEIKEKISH